MKFLQMGELSPGRLVWTRWLTRIKSLKAFTNTRRRLPLPRTPLSQFVWGSQPEVFSLVEGLFILSLRSSKRGAADGLSGMTADHLQPMLDIVRDTSIFFQFSTVLARGQASAAAVGGVTSTLDLLNQSSGNRTQLDDGQMNRENQHPNLRWLG